MTEKIEAPIFTKEMGKAIISQVYCRPDQFFEAGAVLLDIETDKVILEVTAPCHCTVEKLNVEQGQEVFSKQLLGEINVDENYIPEERQEPEIQTPTSESVQSKPFLSGIMGVILGFVLGVIVTIGVYGG